MDQDARYLTHAVSRAFFNLDYDALVPRAESVPRVNIVVQLQTGSVKWALKRFASTRPRADSAVDGWAPSFSTDELTGPELKRLE